MFDPTPLQLRQEQRGRVRFYDGLSDVEVNRALDEQSERVEAMMFTGVVVTDSKGRPLQDPETGEMVVEEDGCRGTVSRLRQAHAPGYCPACTGDGCLVRTVLETALETTRRFCFKVVMTDPAGVVERAGLDAREDNLIKDRSGMQRLQALAGEGLWYGAPGEVPC